MPGQIGDPLPIQWPPAKPSENPSYAVSIVNVVEANGQMRVAIQFSGAPNAQYFRPDLESASISFAMLQVVTTAVRLGREVDITAPTDEKGARLANPEPGRVGAVSIGGLLQSGEGIVRDVGAHGAKFSPYQERMRVVLQHKGIKNQEVFLYPTDPMAIVEFARAAEAMASGQLYRPPPKL